MLTLLASLMLNLSLAHCTTLLYELKHMYICLATHFDAQTDGSLALPDMLCELTPLFIPNVPWGCPHKPADRVLLHVLRHVYSHHGILRHSCAKVNPYATRQISLLANKHGCCSSSPTGSGAYARQLTFAECVGSSTRPIPIQQLRYSASAKWNR